MRKDIFIVGIRILGVWNFVGAILPLAYVISDYIGYIHPQSYSHEYNILRFGVEIFMGLFFILRPYTIFHFIELLNIDGDEHQEDNRDINEAESETK